ncbi:GNAT family N-acetyltransferase [Marinomonas sp. C2222]|uniref:GNAT family N-acetyltransferase n=1 Tax=Marinomonas sargassi TaxID=2984494 RepID=A0ABT2YTW8_9GAMM|nr:GNAT family N-acetyltransferase [Marinomonas sargassi]MCV2403337.1 GNAT family N-acetyltransferase [Marinomonas sargassi]
MSLSITIQRVSIDAVLPLRHQVLWPNKSIDECRVENDIDGLHFGAYKDENLVCVASIFIEENSVRLRKFATLEAFQGQGIGSQMLEHLMSFLANYFKEQKYIFWCDARESAIALYERFGMKIEGERFFKGEIPYRQMAVHKS